MKFIAGIDGGGSKTRVCCQNLQGETLARWTFGPLNINSIGRTAFITRLREITDRLDTFGTCLALCIGTAGKSNPEVKELVSQAMKQAGIRRWRLVGDHEIVLRAVFDGSRAGCALIAGTGSICCGTDRYGKMLRVGGWGHLIGDEGSGYAVGRDALAAVSRQMDDRGERTMLAKLLKRDFGIDSRETLIQYTYDGDKHKLAAIAPLVQEAAANGDKTARHILQKHARELGELVCTLKEKLSPDDICEVTLAGGMLEQNTLFRRMTVEAVEKSLPGVHCAVPEHSPEEGAALLAEEMLTQADRTAEIKTEKELLRGCALGIDIGGTTIKYAVIKGREILHKTQRKTPRTADEMWQEITAAYQKLKKIYCVETVGVGTPGTIRSGLVYASNLSFDGVPLEKILCERLDEPVFIDNDANCASLGELVFGAFGSCKTIVLITLGTGIGGGVIINRQICRGRGGMGDFGHMTIQFQNGLKCPCGNTGCWERYASGAALIRQAKEAALEHKTSILYETYRQKDGCLEGEDVFHAAKLGCRTAEDVLNGYFFSLAAGIESLNNILDPDIFILAGGITAQGDYLLQPLREKLKPEIRVELSELRGYAGALGAAILGSRRKGDLP